MVDKDTEMLLLEDRALEAKNTEPDEKEKSVKDSDKEKKSRSRE